MDEQLEILADMFAAMQGDHAAKLRVMEKKDKIKVQGNKVTVETKDGPKECFVS